MIGNLVFDDINCNAYGVYVTDIDVDNAPIRIYQTESIPGRNGDIVFDTKSYENITIQYPAFVYDEYDSNIIAIRNRFASKIGYKRLEDSFHPDEYRLARYSSPMTVAKTNDRKLGRFAFEFDCKPQRYLKIGEEPITYTANGTIFNPTEMEARPFMRVYGQGVLTVNGTAVTISSTSSYIDLDCELQDAYYGSQNLNKYVSLSPNEFPKLSAGANAITLGSGITRVIITPRWWRI